MELLSHILYHEVLRSLWVLDALSVLMFAVVLQMGASRGVDAAWVTIGDMASSSIGSLFIGDRRR